MNKIFKADPVIFVCSLLLFLIGLFTLYSLTGSNIESRAEYFNKEFTNQLIYGLIGVILGALTFLMPMYYLRLKWILIILYAVTTLLLVYTVFFGLDIKGVRRWISIGGQVLDDGSVIGGFTIQASEFAKLSLIIVASSLLSIPIANEEKKTLLVNKLKQYFYKNKYTLFAILSGIGFLILIIAQKSLSVAGVTGIIFLSVFFASIKNKLHSILLFISFILSILISQNIFFNFDLIVRIVIFLFPVGIYIYSVYSEKLNEITVFLVIAFGVISGAFLVNFVWNDVLRDYQRARVENFLSAETDLEAEGFQQYQSIISIGAGQIFGQGFTQVSDTRLLLLPEPTTDFVFAIFSYKFGFVGSLILIALFLILIVRIFQLADTMNDKYSSLILIGVGTMITVQFFFNIGMNMGVLPVGGTTLPFISAGGSSLISIMIAIGLVENVIASNNMEKNIHQRRDKVIIEGWNA